MEILPSFLCLLYPILEVIGPDLFPHAMPVLTETIALCQQILPCGSRNVQVMWFGQVCPYPALLGAEHEDQLGCCPQKPHVLMCRSTDFGAARTGQLPSDLDALQKTDKATPPGALLTVLVLWGFCLVAWEFFLKRKRNGGRERRWEGKGELFALTGTLFVCYFVNLLLKFLPASLEL